MESKAHTKIVERIAPSGLMTTAQAADYLSIKPSTFQVWRSTNRKKLPFAKIGGNVRYRRADLDAFISANIRNAE